MFLKIITLLRPAFFFVLFLLLSAGIYLFVNKSHLQKNYRLEPSGDNEVDGQIKIAREQLKQIQASAKGIVSLNKILSEEIGQLISGGYNILSYLSKNPDRMPLARNFFGYYLPTINKLLVSYIEFKTHNAARETTAEIEKLIPAMEEVFDKQLDRLIMDRELDISTDIAVLESKLTGNELHSNKYEKK